MRDSSSHIDKLRRRFLGRSPIDGRYVLLEAVDTPVGHNGDVGAGHKAIAQVNGKGPRPGRPPPCLSGKFRWYGWTKRGSDILAGLALSVAALPIIALAAIIVKLTSRGPAFYSQVRLGRHGQPFKIHKI